MPGHVDEEDGNFFLFEVNEVGPLHLESGFHVFQQELSLKAWERVRKRFKLPTSGSCRSQCAACRAANASP